MGSKWISIKIKSIVKSGFAILYGVNTFQIWDWILSINYTGLILYAFVTIKSTRIKIRETERLFI